MPDPSGQNLEVSWMERLNAKWGLRAPRRIEDWELDLAAQVHQSLLPKSVQHPRIAIDSRYVPVDGIGGDYCQVLFPDEESCCISICDVMGHGFGAALLATRVSSEVRTLTFEGHRPGKIVGRLNTFLLQNFGDAGLNATFFAARIDLKRRTMVYSGAGHPSQLLFRAKVGRIEPLVSQNMLLGIAKNCLADEPEDTVRLKPGDRLLCYTDGLTEAIASASGLPRVLAEDNGVNRLCSESVSEMIEMVMECVLQLDGGALADDVTVVVAEMR